jgi:flagellar biosynthesis GTPase FlhF
MLKMNITEFRERLKRAQTVTASMDGEVNASQGAKTVLEQMRRSALTDLKAELAKLVELLGMTHRKLMFIGQVGVGKTTAI